MKLTTIILMVTMLQVSAVSYGQRITFAQKNVTLDKVFSEIRKQTGYTILFSNVALKGSNRINANFNNVALEEVLDKLILKKDLTYSIEEKVIIIKRKEKSLLDDIIARFQAIDVKGKITDENGNGLAGATVKIKGTNRQTTTDTNGQFNLENVDENAMLEISYLGYEPMKIKVSQKPLIIQMISASGKLEEVEINAGYYTVKDRERTGSISQITAETISKQSVSNPLLTLQGRVPGLIITQNSGMNGAGIKIQIRGQSSLMQGSDPLFIIDGIPLSTGNNSINAVSNATGPNGISPLVTINPQDIQSIEVLKDADATSIYGSRGANGVILITTKKGQPGKMKLDVNLYSGFSKATGMMDMLNTQQYIEMRKEAFKNDGTVMTNSNAPDILLWDNSRYTDFKDLLIGGTANSNDVQVSLKGGSNNTQYSVGSGYHKETTVFPGDVSDRRTSTHISLNNQSDDKKFEMGLLASYSSYQSNLLGGDLTRYINMPPNLQLYDKDGNLNWQEGGVFFGSLINNPLASLNEKYDGKFQNLTSSLNLSYEIFDGLKIKANMGYNSVTGDDQSRNPSTSINPGTGNLPFANFGKNNSNSWIIEPQLQYIKQVGKGIFTILLGGTLQDLSSKSLSVLALNYNSDILLGSVGNAGSTLPSNSDSHYKYNAAYGRINYNWDQKYIINLTGRRDGSSRFGPGKQIANFGAVGAAWLFSNEPFVQRNLPFLSFGKLRGSYGITGNDQIGNYKYLNTWISGGQPYQGIPGLQPSSLFNADFAWETTRKSEIAIELGMFKDKVQLTAAYFNSHSGNQLINYKLPSQTGFPSILKNFDALIENSGLEFSLSTKNISHKNFSWNTAFNLTAAKNKLIGFPGLATSTYANTYFLGQSLSTKKVYEYLGVNTQTGIYDFKDVNNDGAIGTADKVVLKDTQPKFYGGLQNSFIYKAFQIDIFLEFKKQLGYNYLNTQSSYIPGYYYINQPVIVLERWQNKDDIANIQRFAATGASAAFTPANDYLTASEAIYSDASYIRLKNVALSYVFPSSLIKKMHLQNLRLYIQGQNLLTITNYVGADPENQNMLTLPPLRTFTAGIQFTL